MCGKLGRASSMCEDYQTKGFDTKGKTYYGLLEIYITEIFQLLQK